MDLYLARFPARWNHLAERDLRHINMLEQILIAKVFNLGGIYSRGNFVSSHFLQNVTRLSHRNSSHAQDECQAGEHPVADA